MVRRLCDRRAGLGGDGVLRVVRSRARARRARRPGRGARRAASGSWTTATPTARTPRCAATASGSSCTCWSPRGCSTAPRARPACWSAPAAARGGSARPRTASYWVDMGPARPFGDGEARRRGQVFPGLAVSMGNPHLACLTEVDVDTLDLAAAPAFDAGAVPRGRQRRADQRAGARRAHPAAGVRARGGGDPLVRYRRLRRRLRGPGRRRPDRGDRHRRRPRGPPVGAGRRRDDGAHRSGRLVSAGVLCAEWLGA